MITNLISVGVILLVVSAVCVFSNYYYWKGRLSGWLDCEKEAQDEANESSKKANKNFKFDEDLVWTDRAITIVKKI